MPVALQTRAPGAKWLPRHGSSAAGSRSCPRRSRPAGGSRPCAETLRAHCRLRLRLRESSAPSPPPRPCKAAPPTACRKGVCSRAQARTSPFFAQRIKLSFASNRKKKEKVKQKVFVDGFNKRDKVTQLLYLLTS